MMRASHKLVISLHFKKYLMVFAILFCFMASYAHDKGHKIHGQIDGYVGQEIFLAMMYGGNQYVVDTATVVNGAFIFESIYNLQSGVYLVVMPPTKSFLLLIDQNEQAFKFRATVDDISGSILFDGSPDNTNYYAYYRFFEEKRIELDKIKTSYDANVNEPDKAALFSRMQQLKNEIVTYQKELVARTSGSLTAAMVKCELPIETPAFTGSPEEINLKKYVFQKNHYFDNIDIADERLIRAPRNVLVDRVDYYLDHMVPQQPDSIIAGVDYVLRKCEKTQASYQFFLTHIFNKYRQAQSIGMDAIYVHIAEQYIAKGKAPWIEPKEKTEVMAAVKKISPTLIGKKAPDFTIQQQDGKDISLYSIQSPYTVLFFWAPDCAHCQESIPALNSFYNTYKAKGVQVFAVCTKVNEKERSCWEYVDKNKLHGWIHGSDQRGGSSAIHAQYNITTTPEIFILGQDKTIIAKDMGVEHLDDVMNRLLPE